MPLTDLPDVKFVYQPCGTCWGQRRIYVQHGDHLEPHICGTCLGAGEIARTDALSANDPQETTPS